MWLIMVILIFPGIFIDQVSMMMITLPFFMPLVQKLASTPSGWVCCSSLHATGPADAAARPLLMTMRGVAPPEVTMAHIFQAVVPYIILSSVTARPAAGGA